MSKSFEEIYLSHIYKGTSLVQQNYLEHHGILGMKWGIRRFQNKDGSLTKEGKDRYRKVGDREQSAVYAIAKSAKYNQDISDKVFKKLGIDKSYIDEANRVLKNGLKEDQAITKEKDILFKELEKDEDKMTYYSVASEMASNAYYLGDGDLDNVSIGDLASSAYLALFDDGQQSGINAYSMFSYKNNLEDKVNILVERDVANTKSTRNAAREVFNEALASVGAENFNVYPNNQKYTLANAMTEHLINAKYSDWKDTNGGWYLNEASFASQFSDNDKQNIQKAEKYVRKISRYNDENTWNFLNEALDDLGFSNIPVKDITQNQWDLINSKISELR